MGLVDSGSRLICVEAPGASTVFVFRECLHKLSSFSRCRVREEDSFSSRFYGSYCRIQGEFHA